MAAGYGPDNIVLNIFLQPVPGEAQSLEVVLYLVNLAANSLDGDTFRVYNSTTDVAADLAASFISAAVAQALNDAFDQTPKPGQILVGSVDVVGGDTYADGLADVIAAGANFYGIALDVRTDTDILLVSAAVETADFRQFVLQSADADWLTSGFPAALTAIDTREHTVITYHDIAAEVGDLAWACNRLAISPDVKSVPWPAKLFSVLPNATTPTTTQQGFALANKVNLGLAWGTVANWMSPGVNANNRPIENIVSVDWFKTRLEERWTLLFQEVSLRGDAMLTNPTGQAQIGAILRALVEEGLALGHLDTAVKTDGTLLPRIIPLPITPADVTAQQVRFDVELLWANAAQAVTANLFFQTTVG